MYAVLIPLIFLGGCALLTQKTSAPEDTGSAADTASSATDAPSSAATTIPADDDGPLQCSGPLPGQGVIEIEMELGQYGNQGEAKLSRIKAEKRLDIPQLEALVKAIATAPESSIITEQRPTREVLLKRSPELVQIETMDNTPLEEGEASSASRRRCQLFWYFRNREYWNNAIIAISLLAQKYAEIDDKTGIQEAIRFCQLYKARIERQKRADESFAPGEYFEAILNLTEAELKSLTKGKQLTYQIIQDLFAAGVNGTLARSKIPVSQFELVKDLFVDPTAETLVFKPEITMGDIDKLRIPDNLKRTLEQARTKLWTVKKSDLPPEEFERMKESFIDPSADTLIFKPGVTFETVCQAKFDLSEATKALLHQNCLSRNEQIYLQAEIIKEKHQYYLAARKQAYDAINAFLATKDKFFWPSYPDYFSIPKALIVLGDLDVKLKETDREMIAYLRQNDPRNTTEIDRLEKECTQLINAAFTLYDTLEDINNNAGINLDLDLVGGLRLKIKLTPDEINNALSSNEAKGYLSEAEREEAQKGIFHYLRAVTMLKKAALVAQILSFDPKDYPPELKLRFGGYIQKSTIPANEFEQLKTLFVDPSLEILEFTPGLTDEAIDQLATTIATTTSTTIAPTTIAPTTIALLKDSLADTVKERTDKKLAYIEEICDLIGSTVTEKKVLVLIHDLRASFNIQSTIPAEEINAVAKALEYAFPPFDPNHDAMVSAAAQVRAIAKKGPVTTEAGKRELNTLLQDITAVFQAAIDAQGDTVYTELAQGAKKSNDFFFAFGNVVKADLYLAYADYYKFPYESLANTDELAMSDRYVEQAEYLYNDRALYTNEGKASAHPFSYLDAWAVTKLVEIDIRFARHLGKQSELIARLASVSSNFEEAEYLRTELMHLQAVLFISRCTKKRVKLLDKQGGTPIRLRMPDDRKLADHRATLVFEEAYYLPDPQEIYFQTWSQLKHAEALNRQGKPTDAIELYKAIERDLHTLLPYKERLAWREQSFYAELYFEWAIALLSKGLDGEGRAFLGCNGETTRTALYYSVRSENKFDYGTRQEWIRRGCGQRSIDFDLLLGGSEIEDLFNLDTSPDKAAFEQLLREGAR